MTKDTNIKNKVRTLIETSLLIDPNRKIYWLKAIETWSDENLKQAKQILLESKQKLDRPLIENLSSDNAGKKILKLLEIKNTTKRKSLSFQEEKNTENENPENFLDDALAST